MRGRIDPINREALIEEAWKRAATFVERTHTPDAERAQVWSLAAKNMAATLHSLIGASVTERRWRDG